LIDAVRNESEHGYQMLLEICLLVKQLELEKAEFAQSLADYNIFETFELFLTKPNKSNPYLKKKLKP
jgi:hypothetical protein